MQNSHTMLALKSLGKLCRFEGVSYSIFQDADVGGVGVIRADCGALRLVVARSH
jgi:hypothetical protein